MDSSKNYSPQILETYEQYIPSNAPLVENLFKGILIATCILFAVVAYVFSTVEPDPVKISEKIDKLRASFVIQEQKKVEKVEKKPEKKVEKRDTPVDLTDTPKLKAREDVKAENPLPQKKKKKVRPVYGLRRVYSTGLGSGGKLSDAVVGKYGNTINKDVDTLTATKEDVKGEVVSVTTVSSNPKYIKRPRPQSTPEMRENNVEGTIRVKVLIDIDGKVKKAEVLNDLGHGSAELARQACFAAEFVPAMRNGEPVAVWITIPIRFALLG